MRSLLLNTTDLEGGAAIATYRLHTALRQAGVDSTLKVQRKSSSDPSVSGPGTTIQRALARPRRALDQLILRAYRKRDRQLFSPAVIPDRIAAEVSRLDPDLVHLFWVAGGFLRPESLAHFNRPVIWTLHDMWPFTGGCHYDSACGRYATGCGACPRLGSLREADLSRQVLRRKLRAWEDVDLTVVATSRWLATCAASSSLFAGRRVEVIPNCVDLDVYRPMDVAAARSALGLPQDRQLILLSAFSATTDSRKGYQHLAPAIRLLASRGWASKAELVVLGAAAPKEPEDLGMRVQYIPRLSDEQSQVLLYSACDVLVAPSVQENLSNTVMESLACGTPVVAFDIGGMPDMIGHRERGYLARPFDPTDLAAGIEWVLGTACEGGPVALDARAHAVKNYGFDLVSAQYSKLYEEVTQ